jgi:hypothetical protein
MRTRDVANDHAFESEFGDLGDHVRECAYFFDWSAAADGITDAVIGDGLACSIGAHGLVPAGWSTHATKHPCGDGVYRRPRP